MAESSSRNKLTDKQRRFVDEYLLDLNAAQAAIRAGYSAKTASRIGPQLLGKSWVRDAIDARMGKRQQRVEVTQDDVVRELAAMALYDPAEIAGVEIKTQADIARLPESVRRAIVGWKFDREGRIELKLSPKTPSLELLGRHLSMWKDSVALTGKDGGPIETRELGETERVARLASILTLALQRKKQAKADDDDDAKP